MLSPTHRPRARLLAGCTAGQSVPCDPNTYNDVGGSTSINAGACKPCPPNSQSPQASTKIEDCICNGIEEEGDTGFFWDSSKEVYGIGGAMIENPLSGSPPPGRSASRSTHP